MSALDQPIVEETPVGKGRWTWFEKILPPAIVLAVMIREIFSSLMANNIILILSSILGVGYLVAFYWIAKPLVRNVRIVLVTLLYGFAFFCGTFAFIFLILFLSGAKEMSIVTGVTFVVVLIIDTSTSQGKMGVTDRRMLIRIVAMATIVTTLYLIPEKVHIPFTYRKYPEFVSFYKEHQMDGRFQQLFEEFQENNPTIFE